MGSSEKFCLKWNDFESNVSVAFRELRDDRDFFDVTLACEDDQIQAHKVILSACSPFFRGVLRKNPHQHPLLYLKGISFRDIQSVLNFMYHGEANIAQEDLNNFLSVAEELKVKGLTQGNSDSSSNSTSNNSRPKIEPHRQNKDKSSSFRKPPAQPQSAVAPLAEDDDDIQEVASVPIKQETVEGVKSQAQYPRYSQEQQVQDQDHQLATGGEFDEGQYYEEYDDSYGGDYSQHGAGAMVDKGEELQLEIVYNMQNLVFVLSCEWRLQIWSFW